MADAKGFGAKFPETEKAVVAVSLEAQKRFAESVNDLASKQGRHLQTGAAISPTEAQLQKHAEESLTPTDMAKIEAALAADLVAALVEPVGK